MCEINKRSKPSVDPLNAEKPAPERNPGLCQLDLRPARWLDWLLRQAGAYRYDAGRPINQGNAPRVEAQRCVNLLGLSSHP